MRLFLFPGNQDDHNLVDEIYLEVTVSPEKAKSHISRILDIVRLANKKIRIKN